MSMAACSSDDSNIGVMLGKFLSECIDVILESRDPCGNSRVLRSNSGMKSGDCVVPSGNVCPRPVCKLQTMVVDVILERRTLDGGKVQSLEEAMVFQNLLQKQLYIDCDGTELDEQGGVGKSKKIIERWILEYDGKTDNNDGKREKNRRGSRISRLHKRLTMLVRSLYSVIRLLPAYRIFRQLRSSNNINPPYSIKTRVSTLVLPVNFREEALMQRFKFAPIDSSCGRLCISVMYQSSGYDLVSEGSPSRSAAVTSPSMSPILITDYVGSPLVEPLRRFPVGPRSCSLSSLKPFPRLQSGSYHLGSQGGFMNADKVVGAMKNYAIAEKACLSGKGKMAKNHGRKTSFSNILRGPSFSESSGLSSKDAGENSIMNFPFDVHDDDPMDSACRSGSFYQNDRTSQSFPFRISHEATVGSLVDMLNKAAPLHRDYPNSLNLSRTSKLLMGRNHIQACYRRTTADAFEELKVYREMKKTLLMLGAGSRSLLTSDSEIEPSNKVHKN